MNATTDAPKSQTTTVLAVILGVTTLLAVMIAAFAWPTSESGPQDLPIVVAGPEQATAAVTDQLTSADPDAFDVTTVADRDAAVQAIEDREAYGAIVVGQQPELLTATAASPSVAQLLTQAVTAQSDGTAPTVTDVAPLPEDDPRGAIFGLTALPLMFGGMIAGVVSSLVVRGRWAKTLTVAGIAVGGGLVAAGLLQGWLGALTGSYLANASVIAMTIAATASVMVGLHALIGYAGIGITALTMLLVSNPLSGISSAPEMLPAGWGALGQLLPLGAGGQALRSTAFFDGAGAAGPLTVLAVWVVVGLGLLGLSALRGRRSADGSSPERAPESEPAEVATA